MSQFDDLAADLDLARRQRAARLSTVRDPDTLMADLHSMAFSTGDTVTDTVTGLTATVEGFGVEQVPTESEG